MLVEVRFEVLYETFEALCDFFHSLTCVFPDFAGLRRAVYVIVSATFESFRSFVHKPSTY